MNKSSVGRILRTCFMEDNPDCETPAQLAAKSGLGLAVVNGILNDRIRITPAISKRLVDAFDNLEDPNFWMRMQAGCDRRNQDVDSRAKN